MGLNICLFRVTDEGFFNGLRPEPWWDEGRHTGDREFARYLGDVDFVTGPADDTLFRPVDFAAAIAWVGANIEPSGNRQRLTDLLARMRDDPALYLYMSV